MSRQQGAADVRQSARRRHRRLGRTACDDNRRLRQCVSRYVDVETQTIFPRQPNHFSTKTSHGNFKLQQWRTSITAKRRKIRGISFSHSTNGLHFQTICNAHVGLFIRFWWWFFFRCFLPRLRTTTLRQPKTRPWNTTNRFRSTTALNINEREKTPRATATDRRHRLDSHPIAIVCRQSRNFAT